MALQWGEPVTQVIVSLLWRITLKLRLG